jgi:HlyD family secretion protein
VKKWLRRLLWIVPLVVIVAAVVVSMQPKPVQVEVTTAQTAPMRTTVDGRGRTRVQDRYVVLAPVHGNLGRVQLHSGDAVGEGDVLARIEPIAPPLLDSSQRRELAARAEASGAAERQSTAGVARAEARLRFAKKDLARVRALFEDGTLSRAELEAEELAVDVATKDLESAKFGARVAKHEKSMAVAAFERTSQKPAGPKAKASDAPAPVEQLEIHSPVAGRVLRIVRQSEGVVQPGESLLEVADLHALEVVVDVLTTDAINVSQGDAVEFLRWGGEVTLHGRVRLIEPAAFTRISALGVEEQRVNVIIDIVEPPDERPRLGDGFALDAEVIVWSQDSVLQLPLSAVFRDSAGWNCYVVEDGVAHVRPVQLGHRNDFEVEITSGITAGERVIMHPSDRISDGVAVEAAEG